MSHTLHHLRKARLQRSELAVPGSNPTMIDKAAASAADFVFLDIEDGLSSVRHSATLLTLSQHLNGPLSGEAAPHS